MHFDETVFGGDFLHTSRRCWRWPWAPKIIDLMDRMGVPFNRTPEGFRDQRRFGGTLFRRTAFAGATTGQQLLYALDEQMRRWEVDGRSSKNTSSGISSGRYPRGGRLLGIVAQDIVTMEISAFPADAVVMATGGNGLIFGKSTMSVICTGGAAPLYQAERNMATPSSSRSTPPPFPARTSAASSASRPGAKAAECGCPAGRSDTRHRTHPRDQRSYFLEERYPKYGNLVRGYRHTRNFPDLRREGLGVGGEYMVYLDLGRYSAGRHAILQARRHPRNLREVRRNRSARRSQ